MSIPTPEIIRARRATISIHISPEGGIIVKAPYLIPQFVINNFLKEKESWIEKTLRKVSARVVKKKEYKEGEVFYFLGEPKILAFSDRIKIEINGNQLLFPKALQFRIQKELSQWFLKQAKDVILKRLEVKSMEMSAEYGEVRFSDTSSKWGTCFPDNSLQFNWRLVMAPLVVLDYVVIHELAHTTEKNHSDSFWRKVRRYTPAFRQHRKWLNDNAHLLTV